MGRLTEYFDLMTHDEWPSADERRSFHRINPTDYRDEWKRRHLKTGTPGTSTAVLQELLL